MRTGKKKNEALLFELVQLAETKNIVVRTEKLLREIGYHARSGRCRLKGKDLIIVDRDEPLPEQIHFLADQLAKENFDSEGIPESLKKLLLSQ
jgi:hypothetical protein